MTLVLGVAYPLAMTGVAQVLFPGSSDGSLVKRDGKTVGSKLIGQDFSKNKGYFQSRPSVTDYNPSGTYFNNQGPNQQDLADQLKGFVKDYLKRERPYTPNLTAAQIPPDAVTTSASGVDPQISEANARIQANRVAKERNLPLDRVHADRRRPRQPAAVRARRAEVDQRPRTSTSLSIEEASMTDRPERSLFERDILKAAIVASFGKLDPRQVARNPVMFVVEVGAILSTLIWIVQAFGGDPPGGGGDPAWFTFTVAIWLWLTVVFANFAEAIAEGRGKAQADTLRAMRTETVAKLRDGQTQAGLRARQGRRGRGRGRRGDPRRRHRHPGHRLGRRVGDHRRVGPGDPRVRRRPQRRHRRHARALGPHRGRDHAGARAVVHRADDQARRGRRAAQDAERDRALDPARRPDDRLPRRSRSRCGRSRRSPAPRCRSRS